MRENKGRVAVVDLEVQKLWERDQSQKRKGQGTDNKKERWTALEKQRTKG